MVVVLAIRRLLEYKIVSIQIPSVVSGGVRCQMALLLLVGRWKKMTSWISQNNFLSTKNCIGYKNTIFVAARVLLFMCKTYGKISMYDK